MLDVSHDSKQNKLSLFFLVVFFHGEAILLETTHFLRGQQTPGIIKSSILRNQCKCKCTFDCIVWVGVINQHDPPNKALFVGGGGIGGGLGPSDILENHCFLFEQHTF